MSNESRISILDASAILAYLQEERGQETVEAVLDAGAAWVTTVNTCEVLSKLCEKGMPVEEAQAAIDSLRLTVIDFDSELAQHAASLRVRTMSIGASLGDRACLALAQRTTQTHSSPTVYTAEQSWAKLRWPFKIVLIRPAKRST